MQPKHIALAILAATISGVAFVASKLGLESFTPAQLTALRFLVAGSAAVWLPRPKVSWTVLVWIGLTVFTVQFLLQFFGIALGMSAGLTAFIVQTQALFTVLFVAITMGERPNRRQLTGIFAALAGLGLIGLSPETGFTAAGFALTTASAVSWAVGNVTIKRLKGVEMLNLVVWASLIPPLPALAISVILDGPGSLVTIFARATWIGFGAVIYLGLIATVFAYAITGRLLQRYPAAAATPFALLAPCVGALVSAAVFEERFGAMRLVGMALMLIGVALTALPLSRLRSLTFFRAAH